MTQAQLINAIDKLMPDIVRTQQPAEVMLKFASENNLAPAQLEKLGHAFNTCKTLVGLEKSANRGDTFSLVDVPAMVADYTSYSPAKELDKQTQQVHKQVNRIIKDAYVNDGWEAVIAESGIQKAASTDSIKEAGSLPDIRDIVNSYYAESASKDPVVFEDVSDKSEWVELADRKPHYDIMHKTASAKTEDTYKMQKKASDELKQIAYETKCFLQEKCAALRNQFAGKGDLWAEAVEDIWDAYQEKSASTLKFIEAYFNADKFLVQYPDLEKRAFVRPLVEDRHSVLDTVGEMIEVMEIHKEASSMVKEALTSGPPPPSNNNGTDIAAIGINGVSTGHLNTLSELNDLLASMDADRKEYSGGKKSPFFSTSMEVSAPLKMLDNSIKHIAPKKDEHQKTLDKAEAKAKQEATLQQLLLSDPVLSEADPDKVADIFNTLADVMPDAAGDPMIMGPALKEAIQYDAVPIHLLKDYSSYEGQVLKNKLDQQKIDDYKYHV